MPDLAVGKPAPDLPFTTPEGKKLALRDLLASSGGKPTLLVFFKTSCPVCQLDWPYLQKLHRAHAGALRVVGVSQDAAEGAKKFYTQNGRATFDLLLDPEPAFAASNGAGVESVPHHVLLGPDGVVKKLFSGWSRREIEELDRTFSPGGKPAGVVPEGDPVPSFKPG